MAKIKARDTRPELVVRRWLHRAGYRFRLHRGDLPGRPDIVLPRHRTVVFVHGCFWHRHRAAPGRRRRTLVRSFGCLNFRETSRVIAPSNPRCRTWDGACWSFGNVRHASRICWLNCSRARSIRLRTYPGADRRRIGQPKCRVPRRRSPWAVALRPAIDQRRCSAIGQQSASSGPQHFPREVRPKRSGPPPPSDAPDQLRHSSYTRSWTVYNP